MSNDSVELLQHTYEAFGRGDMPAVMATFAEDIEWSSPEVLPQGMKVTGRDAVGGFFEKLGSTWQDFSIEITAVFGSGDRVCATGHAQGSLDGTRASYGFVHAWTVRDGACARFDEYVDPSHEVISAAAQRLAATSA
jgi:uncharacterized protein